MAGLILWALAIFAPGQQDPDLQAVEALMQQPAPEDALWRLRVFRHLSRLEHAPVDRVLPAWQMLSSPGDDVSQANLVLYQRRHSLALPAVVAQEGPETSLERALAHWGNGQLDLAAVALRKATERFPEDDRFMNNLLWLERRPPGRIRLDGTPRQMALAVLTAH